MMHLSHQKSTFHLVVKDDHQSGNINTSYDDTRSPANTKKKLHGNCKIGI